ncbi:MAG: hypothetical protein ACLR1V_16805 [Coprococcus sp.]
MKRQQDFYEESLTELREPLAFTGGEQMAVHEALYKACFYLWQNICPSGAAGKGRCLLE